jgi:hypothetical protein
MKRFSLNEGKPGTLVGLGPIRVGTFIVLFSGTNHSFILSLGSRLRSFRKKVHICTSGLNEAVLSHSRVLKFERKKYAEISP